LKKGRAAVFSFSRERNKVSGGGVINDNREEKGKRNVMNINTMGRQGEDPLRGGSYLLIGGESFRWLKKT